jgi:hypothetical protein
MIDIQSIDFMDSSRPKDQRPLPVPPPQRGWGGRKVIVKNSGWQRAG